LLTGKITDETKVRSDLRKRCRARQVGVRSRAYGVVI
jgi:hypothetical protein